MTAGEPLVENERRGGADGDASRRGGHGAQRHRDANRRSGQCLDGAGDHEPGPRHLTPGSFQRRRQHSRAYRGVRGRRNDRRQRRPLNAKPHARGNGAQLARCIARKRSCDEQRERHAAQQDRLRDEVEATQDHAEKAEDVEQRAQRARSSSRTKNLTSPRVIWPSSERTCQRSFQLPLSVACACPASTPAGPSGASAMIISDPSGRCRLRRERLRSIWLLKSSLISSSPRATMEFIAGSVYMMITCARAMPGDSAMTAADTPSRIASASTVCFVARNSGAANTLESSKLGCIVGNETCQESVRNRMLPRQQRIHRCEPDCRATCPAARNSGSLRSRITLPHPDWTG